MRVRKTICIFITLLVIMLSSCGVDYRNSLDENLHNQIERVFEEGVPYEIVYQGERYLFTESLVSDVHEDDIVLSWNGPRYGYINTYYSDTADNPTVIFNPRLYEVYLHEDYDYMKDVFIISNTDEEIVFENIFAAECDSAPDFSGFYGKIVELPSKQFPRIKTYVKVVCVDDQWYTWIKENYSKVYIPSDDFIKTISESISSGT